MIPGQFFSYTLPPSRIAQQPIGRGAERASARLLYARKREGSLAITDSFVRSLPEILRPGDLIVVNNSRVIPARFFFEHAGSEMEVLLLNPSASREKVQALARPMKKARAGDELKLSNGLRGFVLGRSEEGDRLELELRTVIEGDSVTDLIAREGRMPIPGYIREGRADQSDSESYQTLFAKTEGSVAAPTAGLHFTPEVCESLKQRGIELAEITLHVGLASFQPVRDASQPEVSEEFYSIGSETRNKIENTKRAGARIVAVGTTTMRALESFALLPKTDSIGEEELLPTKLFIKPGFEFRVADILMTNFHQPETTHLMLVAAFIGEPETEQIYRHALEGPYRFLSYGDAMLLEGGK